MNAAKRYIVPTLPGRITRDCVEVVQARDYDELVASLNAQTQAIRSDLIKLAAEMVRGDGIPSDYCEDHPPRMRRGYWLKQLERVHRRDKTLAIKLRDIANRLSHSAPGGTP